MKKLTLVLVILVTILVGCEKEEIESPVKELKYEVFGGEFSVSYKNENNEIINLVGLNGFSKSMILNNGFETEIAVISQIDSVELNVYLDNRLIHTEHGNWLRYDRII